MENITLNKEFNKLSLTNKRLVVLQDVLDSVINGKLIPKPGDYIYDISSVLGLSALIKPDNKISCKACGLGSLFLSLCKFNDNITYEQAMGCLWKDFNIKYLTIQFEKLFSLEQLYLIECCYEGNDYGSRYGWTKNHDNVNDIAYSYKDIFPDPVDRLFAIVHNMIRNNGIFKPNQDIN